MIPEFVAYPMMLVSACIGIALGACVVALFWARSLNRPDEYASWLGEPCWMRNRYRKGKRWLKYRVVAVSHRGGIAVRRWDDPSGHGAVWVDKSQVPAHVRFDDPLVGGER